MKKQSLNRYFSPLALVILTTSVTLCACGDGNAAGIGSSPVTNPTNTPPAVLTSPGPISQPDTPSRKPLFNSQTGRSLLAWAELMVENVKPGDTDYQHVDGPVTWEGEHGAIKYESRTDCSGFIAALLTQTYGLGKQDFKNWLGKSRPLAISFYTAIEAQQGFKSVGSINEVQAGDLIAIKYPNPAPGDNTGHIMLVAGVPLKRASTKPGVAGTEQWEVPVIDSSSTGHGKEDTRGLGSGSFRDGAGKGTLGLYAQSNGKISGYSWSVEAGSEYYAQTTRPLVIGRLNPQYAL